jgi:cytochrome c oxidase cbb3-type subunit 1
MQSNAALEYDYTVAKLFTYTAIIFGLVGMLIGTLIAAQLAFPELNYLFGEYGTFSRLRPLHTNVVIYGFTVSGVFATFYYSAQRVMKVSMAESPFLMMVGKLQFILYVILAAWMVVTLFMGVTASKEYAQMEWPLDVLTVVVWVLWGVAMFGLIGMRREKALHISMWYFIACFLGVAMLYLFNNMEVPTYFAAGGLGSMMHSVSMYAGTNDALVQ